jgi:GNAT superfamily N-acetyltransferase
MPAVQLRDIVTDADRGAVLALEVMEPDLLGPDYLWRLLIDAPFQGRGYGAATLDAVVDYLRTRPGADVLWTSCVPGDGSPHAFYERYGFVATGEIKWDETVLRSTCTRPTRRLDDRDP